MAGLSIKLLGPLQVVRDGQGVDAFDSSKVRGLLAYLATERDRPHARDTLAGLLWPEYPQRSALNNLRSALANLRQAIGDREAQPPYLLISRETLQFNGQSDHILDIAVLEQLHQLTPEKLQETVEGAGGRFLEGFALPDSTPFEEWLRLKREQYNRLLLEALQCLAGHFESCGAYEQAAKYARQALALEPWMEEAHRQLMRALALGGQRSAALRQFEKCCSLLQDELGIEPEEETKSLAESIRAGILQPSRKVSKAGSESAGDAPPAPGKAPFKGLNYFDEVDAALFFGREKMTAQLVSLVWGCLATEPDSSRFTAVLGASGSGKSSVVRAGLVPTLKGHLPAAGTLPGSGKEGLKQFPGPIHVLTPTAHPLQALALRLTQNRESLLETAALLDSLAADPRSLHLAATRMLDGANGGERILLVIDQFEELFTLCREESARQAFIDNLLAAARAGGPVVVLIVLRADFYARCAPYADLRQALCQRQLYIGAMNDEEARRAILEPARLRGWLLEPGLADLFLRDAGAEAGALPLLSHALLATWQRRRGRTLTLTGYQEAGGVHGAITQTAETVYQQLSPAQQMITRGIFLRLVALGDSLEDNTAPPIYTRRRASLEELLPQDQSAAEVREVLVKLADARLITTAQETAEVAHEALIQEWARLRAWLHENRDALHMQRSLTAAAQEWERLDHDRGALYRGVQLAQVKEWSRSNPGQLSPPERRFVEESIAEEEAQLAAETARQQRELAAAQSLADEQRRRAEEQAQAAGQLRRRAFWLAVAAGGLLLLLLVTISLGLLANRNAGEAQEQTRLAVSRELAAAAINNLTIDPERSVLLALQAWQTADTLAARNALHQALPELHILRTIPIQIGGVPGLSYSPDGRRLAGIDVAGEVTIWDLASGDLLQTLPSDAGEWGTDVAYSPNGRQIAAVWDAQVMVWDVESGQRLFSLPGKTAGTVRRLDFSPDSRKLAVANQDGLPRVWDLATQEQLLAFTGHPDICEAIAYSPDGQRLATGDVAGMVKIWDAVSGAERLSFEAGGGVHSVAFSPDGAQLAVASDISRLGIWNAGSGEPLFNLPTRSGIYDVDYMADGQRLAAAHQDGTTTIWDPLSGRQLLLLAGHVSTVVSAAPSPDSSQLATGGYDGTVKLWDIDPGYELLTIAAHEEPAYDIAFTPDGTRLASVGFDGGAKLWDTKTGLLVQSLPLDGAPAPLSSLALSPDGNKLAAGGWDGTLYLAQIEANEPDFVLPAHQGPIIDLVYSPDGKQVATASWDGSAVIWDAATGEAIKHVSSQDPAGVVLMVSGVAFSPDGAFLFYGGDANDIRQWDLASGNEVQRFDSEGMDTYGIAVSPDGKLLAMGRQDGVVSLWDIATGEQLRQLSAHAGLVLRVAFSEDGKKLASVGFDSSAKVWDVETGQELMTLFGISGNVFSAAFSPDGRYLAASGADGTVRFYTLDMAELVSLARERVTRSLTADECRIYLHSDECPPATAN